MLNTHASDLLPSIQILNPKTLYNPAPFAYSHIAIVRHIQRVLHISGQGGENSQGVLSSDFEQQTRQALINIQLALQATDASLSDIAMLRVLICDYNANRHQVLIQEMQRLWKHIAFPACTLIPVPCLALVGMYIEIEATAYCA